MEQQKRQDMEMFANLTEELETLFLWFEMTTGLATSVLVFLPILCLCIVSITTIIIAHKLERKVKVILINILITDLLFSVNEISRGLQPSLAQLDFDITEHCKVYYYIHLTVLDAQVFSITMYSGCVYVIIKYGIKKLRWRVILPVISASWIVFILLNPLVLWNQVQPYPALGICWFHTPPVNMILRTLLTWTIDGILLTSTSLIFSIMACVYIRKMTIRSRNNAIKKGMLKNLIFLLVVNILDFLHLIVPSIVNHPIQIPVITPANLWETLVPLTVFHLLFNWSAIIPPLTMIMFLKPLQAAFQSCTLPCCPKKQQLESAEHAGNEGKGTTSSST